MGMRRVAGQKERKKERKPLTKEVNGHDVDFTSLEEDVVRARRTRRSWR